MTLERIGLPGIGVSHLDHVGGPAAPEGEARAVRIRVPAGSAYAGGPPATPRGAGIVAVIRGIRVLPHPDPALRIRPGDVLLAAGGTRALARLHELLAAPC
jgi:TrkA domain protein